MDFTFVILSLLVMIAVVVITNRMGQRKKKDVDNPATRLAGAIWGWATVLSATSTPAQSGDMWRVEMELEVHVPGTAPYVARTVWLVNPEAREFLTVGKDVSVRVNPSSPKYVYSHASWATRVE